MSEDDPTPRPDGQPLIPSRASRHQPKRKKLLSRLQRPRPAPPTGDDAAHPDGEAPDRQPPAPDAPRSASGSLFEPAGRAPPTPDRPPAATARPTAGKPPPAAARPARPARPVVRLPRPALAGVAGTSLGLAGGLAAIAIALALVSDALPTAKPPATPAAAEPYSARWVCPLFQGQSGAVTVANIGRGPATLRTTVLTGDKPGPAATRSLGAGATTGLGIRASKPGYVQVEAFNAPIVVTNRTGAGCAPGPGDRWWLPAGDTTQGNDTVVVVANPDSEPAVVDLVPHLTTGALQAQKELFVPPRSARAQALATGYTVGTKPAIEVVAKAGRVVAGALITGKGGAALALLPAQSGLRPDWAFAGGQAGGGKRTELLVTNPNQTALQLQVQVSTAKGTFKPAGQFDKPIDPGAAVALSIPEVGVSGPFAVRARARDGAAPFAASLRVSEGTGDSFSSTVDLGAGDPVAGWLVSKPQPGAKLALANVSSVPLQVRFSNLPGGSRPAGEPITVPAGRVAQGAVPNGASNLLLASSGPGLVAALAGGSVVPSSAVGGVPAQGPVVGGPAAAP